MKYDKILQRMSLANLKELVGKHSFKKWYFEFSYQSFPEEMVDLISQNKAKFENCTFHRCYPKFDNLPRTR